MFGSDEGSVEAVGITIRGYFICSHSSSILITHAPSMLCKAIFICRLKPCAFSFEPSKNQQHALSILCVFPGILEMMEKYC